MGEPKIKVANAKKDLKSIKLTKQQVESGEYQLEEIFELENEGEILGLFWQYDLKDFVQQETSFDESARIRNFGQKEWEHLFNHPFFQRRKPQLIQALDVKTNEEFYLLEQGQKAGPYTLDEIKSRLEDKAVLLTDMVSVDGGLSWGKIYEIDEFDRRRMNLNLNLPSAPEEEVLRAYEDKVIEKIRNQDSETDAIAGLAYIGNMKMGKVTDSNVEDNKYETPEQIEESDNVNTAWIQFFWVGLFAVSLVGIIWLFYPIENTSSSTQGTKLGKMAPVQKLEPSETWKVNEDAQAPNRAPAVRNNNRTSNTDTSRSRQTTPFKQTSTYKRAHKERQNKLRKDDDFVKVENYENENYYDDASEPVELDPVRETLSKETIDPEEAPVEDFDASNQMDPAMERDPAQESEPVEEF